MISHYVNLETKSETKESEELEVVRTKVVRRVKKTKLDSPMCPDLSTSESKIQSSGDSSSSLENRLSKATMDSGLCLETPCSSENDFSDDTKSLDNHQMSFHIEELQQDINVTFSTPKKSSVPDLPCAISSDCKNSEERGVPEGQEDPVDAGCNFDNSPNRLPLQLGDDGNDSNEELEEEEEEEISIYDMHKTSPIKHCDSLSFELENADKMSLHKAGMHPDAHFETSNGVDIVQEEMAKIALEAPEPLNLNVTNNILLYFLVEVFENEEEEFYKLYPGYSNFTEGFSQRIYFLLSNKSAYFIQPGNDVQKFFKCSSLRYCDINYINVDLNYQGFKLISRDKEAFPLHTADAELTRDILSNLELGIRKFIPKLPLPSVYTNAEIQTYLLSKFLASQLDCDLSKIVIHHYVLARWEDYTSSSVTPSGPIYQDYLMYRHKFVKENKATSWKPAFFLLKGGVLYCMETEKSKPLFFIQMCAPHCRGCRRIHLLNRPHAFEIIRSNSDSLQLAASDTLEASKWLQFFLESVSLAGHFIDADRNIQRPACIILVNDKIVITVENTRKGNFNLLAKGNICDLVTVFIDHVTPNFIMLEFEIAEASKSCGEWLIYFESLEEKDTFLDVINQIWSDLRQVPLSIEPLKDLYLLKRYRLVAEELSIEKLALQDFCADEQ
nr:pleckstrin homology domain-containing family M member 2 [Parasteatoda tepidariorum]